jgi:Ca2+-binding EF-hand superfamily protein
MEELRSFGFNISIEVVRKLESRFAPPPKRGDTGNSGISFDRFLMACVTIKDITDKFRALDKENKGEATFTYDTFVSAAGLGA